MRVVVLTLLLLAGGLIASDQAAAQSVGFFPASIDLESGLRGQSYQSRTTLVNQTDEMRIFSIAASGETAPWTTFATAEAPDEAIESIEVPPASEVEVLVTIDIPDSTPNGEITGLNTYDGYTEAAFDSGEGLVTGFEQPVQIKVTGDQVIDLTIGDVAARDVEVGQPLVVRAALTNNGNVDTAPLLTMDVFPLPGDAADAPLDTLSAELAAIPPGQSGSPTAEWDTSGREPGRYRADYALTLDGERLGLGSFEFELKPPGTLAPVGAIMSVDVVRPLTPGAINRADVTFENQGDVPVEVHFTGHVYQDAAALAEAQTPDSLSVPPGGTVVLSAYFQLPEGDAEYELRGRAYYEGAQTDEVAVPFAVGGGDEPLITRWLAIGGGAMVLAGVGVMGTAWLIRRREA